MDDKYIKLPKIGKVKAVIHRIPNDNWLIKSATVSQESDGKYYISVLFEFDNAVNTYIADKTNAIGLDYASDGLYIDSNGNVGTNHKYYRESHDKLAKAQRKLSRMQGSKKHENKSNNYIKQLRKVSKIHRHSCGTLHPEMKDLANRKMVCDCGLAINRDQNAAINILNEGLRLLTEVA